LSEPDGLSFDPAALVDQAVAFADCDRLYLSKAEACIPKIKVTSLAPDVALDLQYRADTHVEPLKTKGFARRSRLY
jgi:hypothetical protein